MGQPAASAWDLTALLNAADANASLAERHLWLIRLMEWLRHAPLAAGEARATPTPVLRLKHLLNVLDRNELHRDKVAALLGVFWREIDTVTLFADFGFSQRMNFFGELGQRLRLRVLPLTPQTTDLGELFALLFPHTSDAAWLDAIDAATLARLIALVAPALALPAGSGAAPRGDWREPLLDGIEFLASAVRASGFSGALRRRMSAPGRSQAVIPERAARRVVQ
jgi:site-specific recombinase